MSGSEKVVHGLRACMDKHWEDDDFAVVKVDMRNAFNTASTSKVGENGQNLGEV